jgi:uncharacterized protein (UPF0548 family)
VTGGLSYDVVGATRPAEPAWTERPAGYLRHSRTLCLGRGSESWAAAAPAVLDWQVKIRSGFRVEPVAGDGRQVRAGADYRLVARIGPVTVHEPVRVVAVVDEPARCGFAYGTRPGHPVSGEEAFVVHRSPDDRVWLTLRSLTRPARGPWRFAFPALLVAQTLYRRRYLRALRG